MGFVRRGVVAALLMGVGVACSGPSRPHPQPLLAAGPVAWVGRTLGSFDTGIPTAGVASDEAGLERLLTAEDGTSVALAPGVRDLVDLDGQHVAVVRASAGDGCVEVDVRAIEVADDEVTVDVVAVDRGGPGDTCHDGVVEYGLLLTLDRSRWPDPPRVRAEHHRSAPHDDEG